MLDFCKGCPFYFVKKEYNRRTENCLIGILPRLEKDRDNCLRNSRKRQIQNNHKAILLSIKPLTLRKIS